MQLGQVVEGAGVDAVEPGLDAIEIVWQERRDAEMAGR